MFEGFLSSGSNAYSASFAVAVASAMYASLVTFRALADEASLATEDMQSRCASFSTTGRYADMASSLAIR